MTVLPSDRRVNYRDRVVVGFNGSPMSWLAVNWAASYAQISHQGLTVVSATEPRPVSLNSVPLLNRFEGSGSLSERMGRAVRHLQVRHPELDVRSLLADASPIDELAEATESASLVVTGTRGLGLVRGAVFGSVTDGVLARASGPVAAVPTAARFAKGPILLGVDRAATARAATLMAFENARRRGAPVLALLIEPTFGWDPRRATERERAEQVLAEARQALTEALQEASSRYPMVPVDSRVVPGRPLPWLLEVSRMASMIVLGTRRNGRVPGLLHASVSRRAAQQAHCPAVVVPDLALTA